MVQVFFILILSAPEGGGFKRGFTTNLARQCRAFSRALKIEKLKAPLFRGPEGAGVTNDWCIIDLLNVFFYRSLGLIGTMKTVTPCKILLKTIN